jgi:hypothetical protein
MSAPKVHLAIGLFGKAACGKSNVDTAQVKEAVTCASCRKTKAFKGAQR